MSKLSKEMYIYNMYMFVCACRDMFSAGGYPLIT